MLYDIYGINLIFVSVYIISMSGCGYELPETIESRTTHKVGACT